MRWMMLASMFLAPVATAAQPSEVGTGGADAANPPPTAHASSTAQAGSAADKRDTKQAESCLRTKIWAGYDSGWSVRTAVNTTMAEGEHRVFLVTLYAGNEYKVLVCGDDDVIDLDLVLHDAEGKEIARDHTDDREPEVVWKPPTTDTYYVALYAAAVRERVEKAAVSMAVTYR